MAEAVGARLVTAGTLVRYRRLVSAARLDALILGHQLGNLIRTGGRGVARCTRCDGRLIVDIEAGVSGEATDPCAG